MAKRYFLFSFKVIPSTDGWKFTLDRVKMNIISYTFNSERTVTEQSTGLRKFSKRMPLFLKGSKRVRTLALFRGQWSDIECPLQKVMESELKKIVSFFLFLSVFPASCPFRTRLSLASSLLLNSVILAHFSAALFLLNSYYTILKHIHYFFGIISLTAFSFLYALKTPIQRKRQCLDKNKSPRPTPMKQVYSCMCGVG